jgi:hypothetical protein
MRPLVIAFVLSLSAFAQSGRISLSFDTSEAEAVLAIAARQSAHQPVTDADWQRLFASAPYVRLKRREASLKRDFTDDEFKQFVLSPDTLKRAPELRETLDAWKRADLNAAARRILPFLPGDTSVRAKVYPMIKPKTNSFVFEVLTDPTIFFYLDPQTSMQAFENTAAHELHHIGLSSIGTRYDAEVKKLTEDVQPAAEWMGAFGEGLAMLAAAGSPDVHPHRDSPPADRERWDRDSADFNQHLRTLDRFFLDIIQGRFATDDAVRQRALEFFGTQGPWYTVGYRMAATIDTESGRAALLACTEDPRRLLATWNEIAAQHNAAASDQWATWSAELLKAVGAVPAR